MNARLNTRLATVGLPAVICAAALSCSDRSREFDLGTGVHDAVVVAVHGADTADARVTGRHTLQTALAYCDYYAQNQGWEDQLEPAALRACAKKELVKLGSRTPEARANCERRTLTTSWGETLRYTGRHRESSLDYDRWADTATGQDIGYGNAQNYLTVQRQYRLLCPSTSDFLVYQLSS